MARCIALLFVICFGAIALARDLSYCEAPYPLIIEPELKDASLLQVIVFSRHGDRAPTKIVPGEGDDKNISWHCHLGIPTRSFATDKTSKASTGLSFHYPRNDEGIFPDNNIWRGNCQAGQLTQIGGEMCTRMGVGMRQIYIDHFHLLPDELTQDDVSSLYLRSTDISRTRESMLSMLEGLYPVSKRKNVYLPIKVYRTSTEYLNPNTDKCPRIFDLLMSNILNNSEWMEKYNSVKGTLDKINTIAGTKGDKEFDDGYSVLAWADVFRARQCHSLPYPCSSDGKDCVTQDMVDAILDVASWEGTMLYTGEELLRLAAGPIYMDILETFINRISTGKGPSYLHYSAHDTTLYAIVSALDGNQDHPPYASTVRMELWQSKDGSSTENYVRIIYNNDVLRPSDCNSEMCPFDDFQSMITKRLTIYDWGRSCARHH